MRSVDDWPLAKILYQISGGKPGSVAVDSFDVTGPWYPPLEGYMSQPRGGASGPRSSRCGGPSLGELSGGNWMAVVDGRLFTGAVRSPVGRVSLPSEGRPYLVFN
jgi:hypothetical protein